MWILLTIVVFLFARWVSRKVNSPLCNPLLISISIIIPILMFFKVPFETYYADNTWITYMLQPAVVALAYPLYEQLPQIRANWRIITFACTLGSVMSMTTTALIAVAFKADLSLIASLLGKSVTTPIAMEVSSHLGGEAAIAAILVLIVGLFGAIFAYPIYNLIGIKSPIARGLTMGTVSHALGTATCAEKNQEDAAFSSLALVLCGVITSIIAPSIFSLVVWFYS
ncbi:LrgB family protein [Vibrio splendidus]|jgi:predicted murein hydrolase (TIGR00659 family)|uniref:CidB/LrgB family autolysis modulator n=1 Tax=Vibrio splendidus TaxID=29497 RepID=A0A2N7FA75_VIBSP|nr:LrgB family protein [Vibrio splendidus]OMO19950.1 CidB/LrgB family autolysis modulator [Vibrio splendidus]PMG38649.1 CidB/LrgB family autolysis modulator [Vibrio splendidus]PMH04299.1 CidB/LrgB family autolysis modulator [Vibrio splendidus]PMI70521.1 CidB/LrgB family autolysis modulator [Vibrio splendidus]PMJ64807.1 CidB/LrgB family autolysis modulator [Vibrio splendidus]